MPYADGTMTPEERDEARREWVERTGGDPADWDEYNDRREAAEREHADQVRSGERGGGGGDTFDSVSADIPVWGWLSGAQAREGERRAAEEAERNRRMWEALGSTAPSAADLTPRYGRERSADDLGSLLMGPSELEQPGLSQDDQRAALGQIGYAQRHLRELIDGGGLSQADRQALTAQRLAQGAQLRGANQAAIQQMGARGMGGGGAELAARLGGQQAYANANAMGDASIMQNAQMRQLAAMQGYGQLGSAYGSAAGRMYDQEAARRSAIDAYNQSNMDWRRGRETRNVAWGNRQADAGANAQQQAYENQARAVTGAAGHNPYGAGAEDRRRQDQSNQAAAGVIGSIIEEIL